MLYIVQCTVVSGNIDNGEPVDVQFYRGHDLAQAISAAAMAAVQYRDLPDPAMPESMQTHVVSVRIDFEEEVRIRVVYNEPVPHEVDVWFTDPMTRDEAEAKIAGWTATHAMSGDTVDVGTAQVYSVWMLPVGEPGNRLRQVWEIVPADTETGATGSTSRCRCGDPIVEGRGPEGYCSDECYNDDPANAEPGATGSTILTVAYDLLGDGNGGEWDENPEYKRAIFEMVADTVGQGFSTSDHAAEIEAMIRNSREG